MIDYTRLIETLKSLKDEIPKPNENSRTFIARFSNCAPDLKREAILMKFFFAYNGLEKIKIRSTNSQIIIQNALKIAEEIHDFYDQDKEDTSLICYSFLVAYDYNVSESQFMSAAGIKHSTPTIVTTAKTQTVQPKAPPVQQKQSSSQQQSKQQDDDSTNKWGKVKEYIWPIIIGALIAWCLLKILNPYIFPETESSNPSPYDSAPSWVSQLGIRDAVIIGESSYHLNQNRMMFHNWTAPYSGTYVFTTYNSGDTFGFISPSEDSKEESITDDDSGIDTNFMITQYYEAGDKIYLRVRYLDPSNMSGDISLYGFYVESWQ